MKCDYESPDYITEYHDNRREFNLGVRLYQGI